jgi:FHS family L-fucose permease-like MFS transporter
MLFLMWGFITCMNDLLIPKFKPDFALSQFQTNLVRSAICGTNLLVSLAYFLISALVGDPINKLGFKNSLVLGLAIGGIGCAICYPAAEAQRYSLFLAAQLILGAGINAVKLPYLALAAFFLLLAAIIFIIPLPAFCNERRIRASVRALRHPHIVWVWLAVLFYVGSEVTEGSILINYLGDPSALGFPANEADKFLSFYWVAR